MAVHYLSPPDRESINWRNQLAKPGHFTQIPFWEER